MVVLLGVGALLVVEFVEGSTPGAGVKKILERWVRGKTFLRGNGREGERDVEVGNGQVLDTFAGQKRVDDAEKAQSTYLETIEMGIASPEETSAMYHQDDAGDCGGECAKAIEEKGKTAKILLWAGTKKASLTGREWDRRSEVVA